jgi:transglutaminase-like putative cysteine protease
VRIEVAHRTDYRFTAPVFLEPHTLRYRPRSNSWQRLDRFDLTIEPAPAALAANLDPDGNDVLVAWFEGLTDTLTIDVRFEVETLRTNPFDFLSPPDSALPEFYPVELRPLLAPYLEGDSVPVLHQYAHATAEAASHDATSLASHLAGRLRDECRYVTRHEGQPRTPVETLQHGEGACRDLAVLYVALCRELGLAARFVGGGLPARRRMARIRPVDRPRRLRPPHRGGGRPHGGGCRPDCRDLSRPGAGGTAANLADHSAGPLRQSSLRKQRTVSSQQAEQTRRMR